MKQEVGEEKELKVEYLLVDLALFASVKDFVKTFVVCYLGDRYTYIPWYSIAVYCLQRTNHKNARAYTRGCNWVCF